MTVSIKKDKAAVDKTEVIYESHIRQRCLHLNIWISTGNIFSKLKAKEAMLVLQ
jgi:hypothetical protein